jgi:glycosyltransferase involved in cell wall biosynthesis
MGWLKDQDGIAVATGILARKSWPHSYRQDLEHLGIPFFISRVGSFPGSYLLNYFSPLSRWVKNLHDRFRPERMVVHLHDAWISGIYLPIKADISCPLSIVDTFHGVRTYKKSAVIKRLLHAVIARRLITYNVTLTSTDNPGIIRANHYFGLPCEMFQQISNGIEDKGLWGCPRSMDPSQPLQIGYISAFDDRKGWRYLVAAVEQLYSEGNRNIKLILAGSGAEQKLAHKWAGEHPQYASFKGYVTNAGTNLIPHLDVLVLPTNLEGMPMVLIEAISCGVPIIATPVDGNLDVVIDGYNGFFVERDAGQIAERLKLLLNNIELLRKLSKQAKLSFLEKFEINRVGNMFLNLYKTTFD